MTVSINGDTGVSAVQDNIVTADKIAAGAVVADIADGTITASKLHTQVQSALGVRNLIINGDMRIAQRGTSVTGITMFGYLTVDRWKHDNYNAGVWTMSQDTDVPTGQGFSKSLKMTCTTAQASLPADARLQQGYRIEGQHLQHLKYGSSSAESVTLSFWVKTNKTGTYVINLYDLDNSKNIGSQYTVSSADTWEKKTLTFSGNTLNNFDNDNNVSLFIEFWFGAGSDKTTGTPPTTWTAIDQTTRAGGITVNLADTVNNYANITGVQLEVGDTATPFEHRPYDMELARCQRYYESGYANHYGGSDGSSNLVTQRPFIVQKRATPTMSYSTTDSFSSPNGNVRRQSASTGGEGDATANNYQVWNHSWSVYCAVSVAHGAARMNFYWYANAEL